MNLHTLTAGTPSSTVFSPHLARALSGLHRLQSVSKGKRHTSTITVVAMDEEQRREARLNHHDVQEEFTKASGAGGQHRNKRNTAVVLTHVPTGIKVSNADQRSQTQNRNVAWDRLREEISNHQLAEQDAEEVNVRRQELGKQPMWAWVEWRNSVKTPKGREAKMDKALKGRLHTLVK